MTLFLSREQVREVDRLAIEELGIPGLKLMENASSGVTGVMRELGVGAGSSVLVACGGGNNGGDGYAIARQLHDLGVPVKILATKSTEHLNGDAQTNARRAEAMEIPLHRLADFPLEPRSLAGVHWVVDALLGTGFEGELREPVLSLVRFLNRESSALDCSILSVDVPSGLDANSGHPGEAAIRAEHTVTFVAPKLGFQHALALEFTGQVHVVGIGVPDSLVERVCR